MGLLGGLGHHRPDALALGFDQQHRGGVAGPWAILVRVSAIEHVQKCYLAAQPAGKAQRIPDSRPAAHPQPHWNQNVAQHKHPPWVLGCRQGITSLLQSTAPLLLLADEAALGG